MAQVNVVLSALGLVFNFLVVMANRGKTLQPNTLLILSLCFSDAMICLVTVVFLGGAIIHRGYFWGISSCYLSCLVLVSCICVSVVMIVSMALERYFACCRNKAISSKSIRLWIVAVWVAVLSLNGFTIIVDQSSPTIMLEDKAWFCIPDYSLRTSPIYEIVCFVVLSLVLIILIICYSYWQVYSTVKTAVQESSRKNTLQLQRVVLIRCLALTGIFFLCWTPEFIAIFLEFVFGRHNPLYLSIMTSIFISLHTVLNPLLIIKLDHAIKCRVINLLILYKNETESDQELQIQAFPIQTKSQISSVMLDAETVKIPSTTLEMKGKN